MVGPALISGHLLIGPVSRERLDIVDREPAQDQLVRAKWLEADVRSVMHARPLRLRASRYRWSRRSSMLSLMRSISAYQSLSALRSGQHATDADALVLSRRTKLATSRTGRPALQLSTVWEMMTPTNRKPSIDGRRTIVICDARASRRRPPGRCRPIRNTSGSGSGFRRVGTWTSCVLPHRCPADGPKRRDETFMADSADG